MNKVISTLDAPQAIGPYSQAIEANGTLYISGQIPIDPKTGQLSTADIKTQTKLVMDNIGAILKAAGYEFRNVVKTTCLLADISDFAAMNEVYAEYYKENPPARSAFAVKDLPKGARLEIETIAVADTLTEKFSSMAKNIFDEVAEKAKQAYPNNGGTGFATSDNKAEEPKQEAKPEPQPEPKQEAQPEPEKPRQIAPESTAYDAEENKTTETSAQEKTTEQKINESIDEAKEKIKNFFNGLMDEIKKAK